jgi:hypothetical protein
MTTNRRIKRPANIPLFLAFSSKKRRDTISAVKRKRMKAMLCGPKYCWRVKKLPRNNAAPKIAYEALSFTLNTRNANTPYSEIVSRGKYFSMMNSGKLVASLNVLAKYKNIGQL